MKNRSPVRVDSSLSSCRQFVLHEVSGPQFMDGHLTLEYGFLPPALPMDHLPDSHRIWDELALQIPELFLSNRTQSILEAMPLLKVSDLPPEYWGRAALVLSLLASAYWRHGMPNYLTVRNNIDDAVLPPSISEPWIEVNELLGRGSRPFQSVRDLFFNNYRFRKPDSEYSLDNIRIENLDMLVPSFGNEAERVFYMSFVDTHSQTGQLVRLVCELDDAIHEQYNPDTVVADVIQILGQMGKEIQGSTKAFMKISPIEKSKTYCDPVQWSKTIGVYALPPSNYVQGGTSGTSIPVLYVMDGLIGRKKFDSYYGEYVKDTSYPLLDLKAKGFIQRITNIGLKDWILEMDPNTNGYPELVNAFNDLVETYSGKDGFLDKHTSKAFNYLGVGTLVGRNQSTSGHERYISSETWKMVCDELKISQVEREKMAMPHGSGEAKFAGAPKGMPPKMAEAMKKGGGHGMDKEKMKAMMAKMMADMPVRERSRPPAENTLSKQEVAKHYRSDDAWLIVDNHVYDVTDYIRRHPGGRDILCAYLGRDSSKAFNQISVHARGKVDKALERMELARVSDEAPSESFQRYESLIYELQKIYAIMEMQEERDEHLATSLLFHLQAHHAFVRDHLGNVFSQLDTQLPLEDLHHHAIFRFVETEDLRDVSAETMARFHDITLRLIAKDKALITQLLNRILEAESPPSVMELCSMIELWQEDVLKLIDQDIPSLQSA